MRIGFIGLGKMGSRMVHKLLMEEHEVVAWNRSPTAVEELKFKVQSFDKLRTKVKSTSQNFKTSKTIEELIKKLDKPRVIWVMVTAGEATQNVLDELSRFVEEGDVIIDGGNSYYKDTEERLKDFKNKGIRYLGIGVSGGIIAAKEGYPMMVGGDKSAYEFVKPILDSLSKPNGGHAYFGEGGAGHFVKMVHNGIEYGMMQSIGEGFGVLDKAPYKLDLLKVAKLWQKGTIVSGFLMDKTAEVVSRDSSLSQVTGSIEATGEAEWAIQQAKDENVAVDVIEKSLEFRKRSQKEPALQNSFAAKMIASLRHAFGGHDVKKKG